MSLYSRSSSASPEAAPVSVEAENAYSRKRKRSKAKSLADVKDAQEIGPIPPVKNPARREAAEASLRVALETYFPERFPLSWSQDQLDFVDDLERIINEGGKQATALPRGSGKTTIAEAAIVVAVIQGKIRFGLIVGANNIAALELLQSIQSEIEGNDLLLEDYPEVCYPFRRLEGVNQRRLFLDGRRLRLGIIKMQILLPDVPGSAASGGIIRCAGLTGRMRGMKYTHTDGSVIRPSFVILDDPQTDKTARTDKQCDKLERTINGTVMGLAGPGKRIAAVMPCTVIRKGDLAWRYLDRQRCPGWHGRRSGFLKSLPKNMEWWQRYWEIRCECLRAGDELAAEATEFYRENRSAMDEGAEAAWPERFLPGEISAIQSFMNIYLEHRLMALAEYQNDPEDVEDAADEKLDAAQVLIRTNGHKRGSLPTRIEYLSVGIDVQKSLLYWSAVGSETTSTSAVVDYGTWPKQRAAIFDLRDAHRTIQKEFPKADLAGQLYGAFDALVGELTAREWKRDDGTLIRLGRIVVDSRFEPDVIFKFCRQSAFRDILVPAMGVRSNQLYMDRKAKDGVRHGVTGDYKLQPAGARPVRYVILDSVRWIHRVLRSLRTPMGSAGAMTLFYAPPTQLQMLAEHLCSEQIRILLEKDTGRQVLQSQMRPGQTENHLLDATKLGLLGNYEQGTRDSIDPPKRTGPRPKRAAKYYEP